jgi:AAA15 family ATPase/GTPase
VNWAPLIYDLMHRGHPRAAFVDEFDASMHPLLIRALVEHFNCEVPKHEARGQLVFATHETTLLDDEAKDAVLRRDQIYLTEKDSTGAARLYSVADFRERNNLNIRKRYLQGRYGALPSLGTLTE